MKWDELHRELQRHASLGDWATYGSVDDGDAVYPLLRLRTPGRAVCVITAGFHGDEQSGPITLAHHLPDIVAYAAARDVALHVYPCLNPSGFDAFTRYNRLGERPNNDVMRYEMPDGTLLGELRPKRPFVAVHPHRGGPQETRAIVAELVQLAPPAAALDIHQDPYITGPLVYAYTFGPPDPYLPLMDASSAHVPVARDGEVDINVHTDPDGLIALHDGSITDWFMRQGVTYTAVLETTTDTPMALYHAVNLIWIRGFIDLAAAG